MSFRSSRLRFNVFKRRTPQPGANPSQKSIRIAKGCELPLTCHAPQHKLLNHESHTLSLGVVAPVLGCNTPIPSRAEKPVRYAAQVQVARFDSGECPPTTGEPIFRSHTVVFTAKALSVEK